MGTLYGVVIGSVLFVLSGYDFPAGLWEVTAGEGFGHGVAGRAARAALWPFAPRRNSAP